MYRNALIILAFTSLAVSADRNKVRKNGDPLAMLDHHLKNIHRSGDYEYLWPWRILIEAAMALEMEAATALEIKDSLEDPQMISNAEKYQINMHLGRYKPDELKIKVKNNYIIIEGTHKGTDDIHKIMEKRFVQRFVLPPGSKPEEVEAVLNEKGILSVTAPKHELPPPPPERDVPITVILREEQPEKPTETVDKIEDTTKVKEVSTQHSSTLGQEDEEATTHVGKIRKKELKTNTKTSKDNEVAKGVEGNGLDALIESEE